MNILSGMLFKNNKTKKIVIVSAVSKDAWTSRKCEAGVPERHVYFNGTRNGRRFGATHISPVTKFEQTYTALVEGR